MKNRESYMRIAYIVSEMSYCKRAQVGALIEKDGNVISIGYNGTPSGWENKCEGEDGKTKEEVLHAESNAIAKMARSSHSCDGATMYITHSPCLECAKMIVQSGINKVYYNKIYRCTKGISILLSHGIECEQI